MIPHGRVISGERDLKTQHGCFTCGRSTAPTPPPRLHRGLLSSYGVPRRSPSLCPFDPFSWEALGPGFAPNSSTFGCSRQRETRGTPAFGGRVGSSSLQSPLPRQLFPTALTTGASWPDQRETLLCERVEEPQKLCSEG